ncbi:hypothetical protein BCR33DRAFT_782449 [Rhizoclosmatium globosum]|uniref:Uncharacterized protein n=1 Tax=Rhizoclosmatium globosum TaxID=329046 RepID=A0A1Y2CNY2_9FUNG|nr:hypothetical protein BCR33DRAFT_782449 [Rhizoclosmatium globosum]|eukprot:ORY48035.1 hypothetical protein BCR33DRAFT_782449 [Rhizoclosmatium globosum]
MSSAPFDSNPFRSSNFTNSAGPAVNSITSHLSELPPSYDSHFIATPGGSTSTLESDERLAAELAAIERDLSMSTEEEQSQIEGDELLARQLSLFSEPEVLSIKASDRKASIRRLQEEEDQRRANGIISSLQQTVNTDKPLPTPPPQTFTYYSGTPNQPVSGSRFTTDPITLDVCAWPHCIAVFDPSTRACLYYTNITSTTPAKNQKYTIQKTSAGGPTLFILSRVGHDHHQRNKLALFDTSIGKAIICTRTRTGLIFSTISGSEKLGWSEGELRVLNGVSGFLNAVDHPGHVASLLSYVGKKVDESGGGMNPADLFAYVESTNREVGGLTRYRLKVGGRGLGKVDLVCASFVAILVMEYTASQHGHHYNGNHAGYGRCDPYKSTGSWNWGHTK